MTRLLPRSLLVLACACLCVACGSGPGSAGDRFVPLFDGQTLDGWRVTGGNAAFRVEDSAIVGTCKNSTPNTFLRTVREDFRDFEFRCQFRWDIPGNSGIQFRSGHKAPRPGQDEGVVFGYQYEIDESERAWTAGVHEESRRGWIVPLKGEANEPKRRAVRHDGWNDVVIRCEGPRVRTWLNGMLIADFTDEAEEALPAGFFALQIHWGESSQLRWRNLAVKELQAE